MKNDKQNPKRNNEPRKLETARKPTQLKVRTDVKAGIGLAAFEPGCGDI